MAKIYVEFGIDQFKIKRSQFIQFFKNSRLYK